MKTCCSHTVRQVINGFLALAIAMLAPSLAAGQACPAGQVGKIIVDPQLPSGYFGGVIEADGDKLIASDSSWPPRLHVLERNDDTWSFVDELPIPPGSGPKAIEGDILVIGVPNMEPAGAVYIYRLIDGEWGFEQRLTLENATLAGFGKSVDVEDGVVVIGGTGELISAQPHQRGAGYVYMHDGRQWNLHQVLTPPPDQSWTELGISIDLHDDVIAIGMPYTGGVNPSMVNSAFVFRRAGDVWNYEQQLQPPWTQVNARFGSEVAIADGWIAVGAPQFDAGGVDGVGQVCVFRDTGAEWVGPQVLELPDPVDSCCATFGQTLTLTSETLVVGAPRLDLEYPQGNSHLSGAAYVYRRRHNVWEFDRRLQQRWILPSYPNVWTVNDSLTGNSIAISGDQILVGSPGGNNSRGQVLVFEVVRPDCDTDGTPNECEPINCNHNALPDACELLIGAVTDCDGNVVPDECDAGFHYAVDSGMYAGTWGVPVYAADLLWLNTFRVKPGGQRLSHVAASFTAYTPHLTPCIALVYSDPNQDGNPDDAVLLGQAPAATNDELSNVALWYSSFPIDELEIGEPGDVFFAGFKITLPIATFAATATQETGPFKGWMTFDRAGKLDLHDPDAAVPFDPLATFAVRAIAIDCDANGTPDFCDIAADPARDLNGDGILDQCEPSCPADAVPAVGDGEVGVDDLLAVLNDWGPCVGPCPGDMTFDDAVNVDDLLLAVNSWGPCPD